MVFCSCSTASLQSVLIKFTRKINSPSRKRASSKSSTMRVARTTNIESFILLVKWMKMIDLRSNQIKRPEEGYKQQARQLCAKKLLP